MPFSKPRLLVAGTSGDAGKTVVAVGLVRAWVRRGRPVAVYKKGPDYIDAAWLSAASGRPARNLDTFLADPAAVKRSFFSTALTKGVNLIEGNRGLHDGFDLEGSHSSAALSKLVECPVVLVQDVTKTTRSAAAFVLGSRLLDEDVKIAGVILNRVGGSRHESLVRRSIETYCGVPVLGALPKLPEESRIPSRHLGLVTPREEERNLELVERLGGTVAACCEADRLLEIARGAPEMELPPETGAEDRSGDVAGKEGGKRPKVCYLSDSAFTFYYPENLESLGAAGAELVPVSPLEAAVLPPCDALYAGGGFPETHAAALAENGSFRKSLFAAAAEGLPVYAECGGLVYMAKSLRWEEKEYPMSGIFPLGVEMGSKPCGHGYTRAVVDGSNPFFEKGTELKGHEFHYSCPASPAPLASFPAGAQGAARAGGFESVFAVKRGTGCGGGRDGLLRWNVLGTYLHVHALGCPAWARGVLGAAERYAERYREKKE